jgi:orotate phosphoribosyltransferase
MICNEETAHLLAAHLLQIKAIKLQPSKPFVWASGWNSPIYCDNRLTLSAPMVRTFIRQHMTQAILEKVAKPQAIAGVATGGIPHGVLVAQELGIPFIYVRSAPKAHGIGNQIEGGITGFTEVVVVEDLVSTGGSSLSAVKALREAGIMVQYMFSVFDYQFPQAQKAFEEAKVKLFSLSAYEPLIQQALTLDYIREEDVQLLKAWRSAPDTWPQN